MNVEFQFFDGFSEVFGSEVDIDDVVVRFCECVCEQKWCCIVVEYVGFWCSKVVYQGEVVCDMFGVVFLIGVELFIQFVVVGCYVCIDSVYKFEICCCWLMCF